MGKESKAGELVVFGATIQGYAQACINLNIVAGSKAENLIGEIDVNGWYQPSTSIGATGPQGPQGPAGPQGPKGDTGPAGEAATGSTGVSIIALVLSIVAIGITVFGKIKKWIIG